MWQKQAEVEAKKSAEKQKKQILRTVWKKIQMGNKDNTEQVSKLNDVDENGEVEYEAT